MTEMVGKLLDLAKAARKKAHAKYSGFYVGAALIDENGNIHVGCNVENASFPEGSCAETGAIAAMVASGGTRIVTIAIVGGKEELEACPPCGGCRQRINEFADQHTQIVLLGADGTPITYRMSDLLPASFSLL